MTELPAVTDAEAFLDQQYFADHPGRRYHRRPGPDGMVWVIRRRGRATFLRTLARTAIRYPDTDEALRQLWFESAWRDLDPIERDELIKAARQAEGAKPAKAARRRPAAPRRHTKTRQGGKRASRSAASAAAEGTSFPSVDVTGGTT